MSTSPATNIRPNEVDQRTKSLLHGFIQSLAKTMNHMIPDSIILMILSFYYLGEYFKEFDDKIYQTTLNNKIIKCVT